MRFAIALFVFLLSTPARAQETVPEAQFRDRFCAGWEREVRNSAGTADCVSADLAVEVDWSEKWKEGIGQALAYGAALDLRPGLILVCRQRDEAKCLAHQLGVEQTISAFGAEMTLWLCSQSDATLDFCIKTEMGRR